MRSPAEVTAVLRTHWPHRTVATVRPLSHTGWGGDNDAFLVDEREVFLFPRHPDAARALAIELCLLPELARRVSVAIPSLQHVVLDPMHGLPLCAGYPALPGEPLTPARFGRHAADDRLQEALAAQLGAFLSGMHTFPLALARRCGVPETPLSPAEQVAQRHTDAQALVYPVLRSRERAFLDRLFAAFQADAQARPWAPALCHGDLTSDHILVEPSRPDRIGGIIDFGDVCLGDPAADFVWHYEYGESFFARVLAHYRGPRGDLAAFRRRVAYRHQLMAVVELAYGVETGNETYVEEGRQRLRGQMDGMAGAHDPPSGG